uniref:Putative secreted peptide n=1 Tax=Anopheles braziliensis TaxID=58242 RepID=A0A2M3ZXB3_9DIPT
MIDREKTLRTTPLLVCLLAVAHVIAGARGGGRRYQQACSVRMCTLLIAYTERPLRTSILFSWRSPLKEGQHIFLAKNRP